ncbi:MAG TPA: PAS domain-containing protein [Dongiaceae bacterium]|nr:PAS domain-containing protein [Dongiaceae bacterium]
MQKVAGKRATPRVERLHRYWLSLARETAGLSHNGLATTGDRLPPPPRHLLDPAAIINLLPHVLLAEFETDPFRIRYRLTGTRIDDVSGANLTGKYLDLLAIGTDAAAFKPMIENYRHAWRSGEAVIDYYQWITENGRLMPVCYGIFPLSINGRIRQAIAIEEQDLEDIADPPKPKLKRWSSPS